MDAAFEGFREFFLHKGREEGREEANEERFKEGLKEGREEGLKEGREEDINNLALHLSKVSGNTLSMEKALEEARAILDPKSVTE